jgi:hypothetical protein
MEDVSATTDREKPKDKPKIKATRGRDVKKSRRTYLAQVEPDVWFRLKKTDLPTLLMDGIVPAPLLKAAERMQEIRTKIAADQIADAFAQVSKEELGSMKELLRRCAVSVTIDPKLTHSKKAAKENPDLPWVGGYSDIEGDNHEAVEEGDVSFAAQMMIWKAVMGEVGVVIMPDDDAHDFRSHESDPTDQAASNGDGVRSEAVVMGSDAGGAAPDQKKEVEFLPV